MDASLNRDSLILNGREETGDAAARISLFLPNCATLPASLAGEKSFPATTSRWGCIASSASAFAALTLAAVTAAGLVLLSASSPHLPPGFWLRCPFHTCRFCRMAYAATHEESFAESFASPDYWNLSMSLPSSATNIKRSCLQGPSVGWYE